MFDTSAENKGALFREAYGSRGWLERGDVGDRWTRIPRQGAYASGDIDVLVATDVAARGFDTDKVHQGRLDE